MTPLEELLRSTLQDPARELPPDPGTIDAALRRRRPLGRRRVAIISTVAACLATTVSAGVLVSGLEARRHATTADANRPLNTPAVVGSRDPEPAQKVLLPEAGVAALAMDSAAVYVLTGHAVLRVERTSGRIVRQRTLPDELGAVALGPADTLWLTTRGQDPRSYALLQLDRRTLAVRRTLHFDDPPVALALAGSTLWAGGFQTLYRLDAADGGIRGRLHHQESSVSLVVDPTQRFLYVSLAEERDGILIARDARTGSELARRNFHARSLVPGGSLWIADLDAGHVATVHRLDPRTLADRELGDVRPLRDEGLAVWPGGGVLWITDATRGTLTCVDPGSARVRGVRMFDATGLLMADAAGLYAATGQGLVQVAPSSVCGG